MAVYLLDKSTYTQLSEEYKTDDPIKLLTEAANDEYAPAQYYLGLLYYSAKDGERVQRDKAKGMVLMQKASSKYAPAKKMVQKIKEQESQPPKKTPWEKFVDAFTPEDQTWGLGYSYSQNFPLTLSANYTYSCLSVAAEFGLNFDGKKYTTNHEFSNILYK